MPKIIKIIELDQIVKLVSKQPNGIGIEDLTLALASAMPRRTLQRRLATLLEQKRILTAGEGRALKYQLAPITVTLNVTEGADTMQAIIEVYVPTSHDGDEIKTYVHLPRQQRKPVSYKKEFLEQYHPTKQLIYQNHYVPNFIVWDVRLQSKHPQELLHAIF